MRNQQQDMRNRCLVSTAIEDSGNWVMTGGVNLRYRDKPLLRGDYAKLQFYIKL